MKKLRVGFIGLGLMGGPMAKNLFKDGFPLVVYNRSPQKLKEFKKMGVEIAQTPQTLASSVDVVITMVTGPQDVWNVLFGKEGVVQGAKKGLIIIDMSTIGPQAVSEIHQKLQEKGIQEKEIEFLDAPVTGSTTRAISGELTIFVGGKKSVFERVKPAFQSMGKDVLLIGDSGMGQAIKLVNNLIVGESLVALSEGMLLADSMHLPREKVVKFLENVPVVSAMMRMKLPNYQKNTYPTAFSIQNMYKDLNLAQQESKKAHKSLPGLGLSAKLYKKAIKQGLGDSDNSGVIQILEKVK